MPVSSLQEMESNSSIDYRQVCETLQLENLQLKQELDQLSVSYDKDADVLYITEGKPRPTIGEIMENGVVVRRDSKTKKVVGFTIIDFIEHFTNAKPQKIPLKAHFLSLQAA